MNSVKVKSKINGEVDTFLLKTFIYYGKISPKSNIRIIFKIGETFEAIKLGELTDTKETYFLINNFILIFPENSFEIVNENSESEQSGS